MLVLRPAVMFSLAETVGTERRRDQLRSLLAEVEEGRDLRELRRVEYCSIDCILCSLGWLSGAGQVSQSVRGPGRSRVNAWWKPLAWECSGGTGGSLHLHLLQWLIELLDRVRPDKATVVMIKYLLVLQRAANTNPAHHRRVDWRGFSEGNPAIKI